MPGVMYTYTARDSLGEVVSGELEATSESVAKSIIKARGLTPLTLTGRAKTGILHQEIKIPGFEKHPTLKELAVMSRQMATMIGAGLPILRTLKILSEQSENEILKKTLAGARADIEGGQSLSMAFSKHPDIFPPIMLGLIKTGETGGFLDQSLDSVASTLENDAELRATVKSAMTYPVAVLIMAVLAVIAMLIWVVPIFDKMFKDLGGQLPLPTQILVWLSPVALWGAPFFVVGFFFFSIWWRKNKNRDSIRKVVDTVKLKTPVFGPLLSKIAIARFSRNLSSMVNAGVPILQAFAIIGETAGSWPMEQALARVQNSIRYGSTLALPMSTEKVFPPMVTQMIAVGEDSGTLGVMLAKIADFYDSEVKATTEQLTSLIEPLMVAVIGVVIGGMIIALYLPIFTVFEQIK